MEEGMSAFRKSVVTIGFVLALAGGAYAATDWLTGSTDEQLKTLAAIQPGLGTVMIEIWQSLLGHLLRRKGWQLASRCLPAQGDARDPGGRRDDASSTG